MDNITVPSFSVDHTTLREGVYERYVDGVHMVKVWDLRVYAPSDHKYMTPEGAHGVEHYLAYELRRRLRDGYIQCCPYGCQTGFMLMTDWKVTEKDVLLALISATNRKVIESDFPSFTEKECGQPKLFSYDDSVQILKDISYTCMTQLCKNELQEFDKNLGLQGVEGEEQGESNAPETRL